MQSTHDAHCDTSLAVHVVHVTTHLGYLRGALLMRPLYVAEVVSATLFRFRGANMNGFKVLAVGAFLYCGPSFCHAQINILDNQSEPRSILVRTGDDRFQPAPQAELTRRNVQAELADPIIDYSGEDKSAEILIDATPSNNNQPHDPASLAVGHGQPNVIDQILRNGLMAQTPSSAQVPIAWPMQQPDNPTARMMLQTGCTAGLWGTYPMERAAECALMYQRLAQSHHAHGCCNLHHGHAACGTGHCGTGHSGTAAKPVNRYAPSNCDSGPFLPISHMSSQPNFQSLLAPVPTPAEPAVAPTSGSVQQQQGNIAQRPGLVR